MSSFQGVDLFGSGPHRTVLGTRKQQVVALAAIVQQPDEPGSVSTGDRDWEIVIRGRLVSETAAGLWTLQQAVIARAGFDAGEGRLIDTLGRVWDGVRLVEYEEEERVLPGRVWSVGYTATFRNFQLTA